MRFSFRVASFVVLLIMLIMGFILAWFGRDVTGFGVVAISVCTPMAGLLVVDYISEPKDKI